MIITVEEVQTILGIDGQADEIQTMIPLAESNAYAFTKNYFHTHQIVTSGRFSGTKLVVEDATYFLAGNFIHITNSILNDGVYKISSVSGNEITLLEALQFEENSRVLIYTCKIPQGYKITLSKFIGSLIGGGANNNKQSETIGDYSYTLAAVSDRLSEYFNPYKIIKVT